jgi:hypothetical protein
MPWSFKFFRPISHRFCAGNMPKESIFFLKFRDATCGKKRYNERINRKAVSTLRASFLCRVEGAGWLDRQLCACTTKPFLSVSETLTVTKFMSVFANEEMFLKEV